MLPACSKIICGSGRQLSSGFVEQHHDWYARFVELKSLTEVLGSEAQWAGFIMLPLNYPCFIISAKVTRGRVFSVGKMECIVMILLPDTFIFDCC